MRVVPTPLPRKLFKLFSLKPIWQTQKIIRHDRPPLLLRGKIVKLFFCAHTHCLERKARTIHDQIHLDRKKLVILTETDPIFEKVSLIKFPEFLFEWVLACIPDNCCDGPENPNFGRQILFDEKSKLISCCP